MLLFSHFSQSYTSIVVYCFNVGSTVSASVGRHLMIMRWLNISHLKSFSHISNLTGSKLFPRRNKCPSLFRLPLSPHWPGLGHMPLLQRSLGKQALGNFGLCCERWFLLARKQGWETTESLWHGKHMKIFWRKIHQDNNT